MASELLKDMLRNADPAVLAALEAAAQADADGGDDSGGDEYDALDLATAGAGGLSAVLMGRALWKGGRKRWERMQKKNAPAAAPGNSIRSGTVSPVDETDPGRGDSADPGEKAPPLKVVVAVARKGAARHYGIADPESLTVVRDEYDVSLSAWRIDFMNMFGVTYHVALKSVGSKVAAVSFERNAA